MLAKLWKKVLLAICVIAILFNLTSKLVRRYSLDTQLDSVVNSGSISDILSPTEEEEKSDKKQNSSKKTNKEDNYIEEESEDEEEFNDYYDEDDEDF